MKSDRIDIVTLGCSKNLVDSERLQKLFCKKGYECYVDAPEVEGETVVVNTCGFIGDAKEESINTRLQFAEAKTKGEIGRLYVMGYPHLQPSSVTAALSMCLNPSNHPAATAPSLGTPCSCSHCH